MKRILLTIVIVLAAYSHAPGESSYEQRLERGLRNTEHYSYYLIEKAHSDPSRVQDHLNEALRYSPDLPAVYFHLAWVTFTTSPSKVYDSLNYFIEGLGAYKRNFWWTFNLSGVIIIGLLLAFVATMLVIALVRISVDLPLITHEIKEDSKNFVLFIVVFFISTMGPLHFLAAVLMIVSFYFNKADIIVTYVFFGVLILLPLFQKTVETSLSAEMSPSTNAIVSVNEGKDNTYALQILKDSDEKEELFSFALAQKREGKIEEAIATYSKLVELYPDDAIVYNNLANCYTILGQFDDAKSLYEKAVSIRPLASAYYNLSKISSEMLNFEEAGSYFDKAKKVDPDAVSRYRESTSRDPLRSYVDETLQKSNLWSYAIRHTQKNIIPITLLPKWFSPVIGLMITATFVALSRMRKNKAFSCKRCGTIICPKCERSLKWGGMCHDCFSALVTFEKDPKDRIAKLLTVYETKTKRKNVIRILSLLVPGAHLIYVGKIMKGALLTFLFLVAPILLLTSLAYRISIYPYMHSWFVFMLAIASFVIYFINIIATRRFLKKWV